MSYKKRQLIRSVIKDFGINGAWVEFLSLTTELHILQCMYTNNNFYVALISGSRTVRVESKFTAPNEHSYSKIDHR